MKKLAKTTITLLAIIALLVIAPVNKTKAQFSASISIQSFYNELEPYGEWIDDPEYGYVWIPDAGPGFRPYYTRGHWVMTRYGAMWVSGYAWGWAPFHYGRWAFSPYYREWVWIPDTVWGPAWVNWRWGSGYCGWSPMGPGVSVSFSLGLNYIIPNDWWVFVPAQHCLSTSFYNYRIAPERNITYVRNTTIINNTYINNNVTYVAGPGRNDIERVSRRKVAVYNVADAGRPGQTSVRGNAVNVYRPQVKKSLTFNENSKPAPRKIISRDQYIKNKEQRNTVAGKNNNRTGTNKQIDQPSRPTERKQVQQQNMPERNKPVNQPSRPVERKQVQQQNMPERNKPVSQPSRPVERKQVQQQNMPERNKPVNQPSRPAERKQVQQQNVPERNKQPNQKPQQSTNPSRPDKKGNGNN